MDLKIRVGNYVIFHVKTNFPFQYVDWVVMSKDIILHSGRENGDNIHPEIKTFSFVASSEMAPGFHILVYAKIGNGKLVSDTAYYPIESFHDNDIQVSTLQIKNYLMSSVEVTCRGQPGSVFLVTSERSMNILTQGIFLLTKTFVLKNLHRLVTNYDLFFIQFLKNIILFL